MSNKCTMKAHTGPETSDVPKVTPVGALESARDVAASLGVHVARTRPSRAGRWPAAHRRGCSPRRSSPTSTGSAALTRDGPDGRPRIRFLGALPAGPNGGIETASEGATT